MGECFIFLQDLLKMRAETTTENGKVSKRIQLAKVLWHDGKNVGNLTGVVMIEYQPFLQQLFAGVMTEQGMQRAAPVVMSLGNKKAVRSPEYTQLVEFLNRLNAMNAEYRNHSFRAEEEQMDYETFKFKDTIESIRKILKKSEKKSSVSWVYSSLEQLMETQALFLDIADALWLKFEGVQGDIERTYCQCFEALFKRGELDLQNIGIDAKVPDAYISPKATLAGRFHKLLIEVLSYVFDQLENKAISNPKRNFIEFFLAYCYFRIPAFREELIRVLSEDQADPVFEARSTVIRTVLFSWKEEFFDQLERLYPRYQQQQMALTEALRKNWRNKFRSRGIIFFYFVKEWCSYVKKTIVVNDIEWEQIPGYQVIVANFLSQVRERPVRKYPDILLESSVSLLNNPKLLKTFFYAVLEKTK